jgi:hypothetical protein
MHAVGCIKGHQQRTFSCLPGMVRVLSGTYQRKRSLEVCHGSSRWSASPGGFKAGLYAIVRLGRPAGTLDAVLICRVEWVRHKLREQITPAGLAS